MVVRTISLCPIALNISTATFVPMFQHAKSFNLRLIAPNLRDYPNSTPFSSSELSDLCSPDSATQRRAFGNIGAEVAAFLSYIIITEKIPPRQDVEGEETGGLVLLGWSMGNLWCLSMLSDSSSMGDDMIEIMQKYLRTYILHGESYSRLRGYENTHNIYPRADPPYFAFGVPIPKELSFQPQREPVSADNQSDAFCDSVCMSYMPLPELTSNVSILASRASMGQDARSASALRNRPFEERALLFDYRALTRSARCLGTLNQELWSEIAENALFFADGAFSNVNAVVLWCDMSHSLTPYGIKHFADRSVETPSSERATRKMAYVKVPNANHVVSVDFLYCVRQWLSLNIV
ncbi:hypothetical protein EIP86_008314 [Pleurotus ostreatoroseus]|nr:hypothetical protein EIP86_008314 [Pleurotus ostreatoroseus]